MPENEKIKFWDRIADQFWNRKNDSINDFELDSIEDHLSGTHDREVFEYLLVLLGNSEQMETYFKNDLHCYAESIYGNT